MRSGWTIGLAALLAAACAPAERDVAGMSGAAAGTLLVGNKGEDTVSFIGLGTGEELARVHTGRMPHEIAVSPDGRQAAVVAYGGRTIDIFDVASRARVRTIDLAPNQGPHGLLWLDDGRIVVTTERSRSLVVVDTRRSDALTTIRTDQQGTHMVAVSPDGRRAYTANIPAGTVSVIDLEAGRKLRDVHIAGAPEGIAHTPDGRTLWVADLDGARVLAFDAQSISAADGTGLAPSASIGVTLQGGSPEEVEARIVKPLERELRAVGAVTGLYSSAATGGATVNATFANGTSPESFTSDVSAALRRAGAAFPAGRTEATVRFLGAKPLAIVPTGERPIRVAVSPDGRWIVTSNFNSGSLTIIDARTRKAVREVLVSGSEVARQVTILFSRDGRRIYAAETGRNQVAEVDFASGKVLRRLKAGKDGDGLAVAPLP